MEGINKNESKESLDIKCFRISGNLVYETSSISKEEFDKIMKDGGDKVIFTSQKGLKDGDGFTPEYTQRKEGNIVLTENNVVESGGDDYDITGTLPEIKKWVEKILKEKLNGIILKNKKTTR